MKKSSKTEEDIANKLKIDEDIANKLELNFSKRGRRKRIKKIIFFLILLGAIGGGYYKYTQQAKTPEKNKIYNTRSSTGRNVTTCYSYWYIRTNKSSRRW